MIDYHLWLLVLGCFCVTYFWRGLGVLISTHVQTDSLVFRWVNCVAYAMLAALVSRMIFLPTGPMEAIPLHQRLFACGIAVTFFFLFKRNLVVGLFTGVAAIVVFGAL